MVDIYDWNDLDAVRNDLTADYVLQNDLGSSTAGYAGIGDDWTPLGFVGGDRDGNPFSGTFDGRGFQISDLVIEENNSAEGGVAFITRVTGLVENLSVDGTVDSTIDDVRYGGLTARNENNVRNCVSHVDVTASSGNSVGGLVGYNDPVSGATITGSYATGSVNGDEEVGGLVGYNRDTVTDSYATGTVDGNRLTGGLTGNNDGTATGCYATGSVTGGDSTGGFAGRNNDTITDCYSTGSVDGDASVGGLVGYNSNTIQTSYTVGSVIGNTTVGALVGENEFATELSDSYADKDTTGQTSLTGSTGGPNTNSYTLTTSEMQGDEASNTGNMDGFDFANIWDTVLTEDSDTTADGYPTLQALDRGKQLSAQSIFSPPGIYVDGVEYDCLVDGTQYNVVQN